MNEQEKLFECFKHLSVKIEDLGSIVQNEGIRCSKEDLSNWIDTTNSTIQTLNNVKENTIQFVKENMMYEEESKLNL